MAYSEWHMNDRKIINLLFMNHELFVNTSYVSFRDFSLSRQKTMSLITYLYYHIITYSVLARITRPYILIKMEE